MIHVLRSSVLSAVMLLLASQSWSQEPLREQVFARADQALAAANEAQASVLAPVSYAEASRYYRDAETALERGRRLEGIREDLDEAITRFDASVAAAQLARVTLGDAIAARDDAIAADAASYAEQQWREAEETFATAARRLEDGTLNGALRAGEEAQGQYRVAELAAIENNYLSGARERIAEADELRVDRYAPITLTRARNLLAEAEESLRRDRYDTDYPRTLARDANYEARHAIYLAERIRAIQERDLSAETVLLEAEAPLVALAGAIDIVAEFDTGFEAPGATILSAVEDLRADSEALTQREEQLAFLEEELASLEARLGDESEQRQLQEQIQRRFEGVDAVFARDEAQVLRRGNDVIVRMGLNFDVGSADIEPEYYPLLGKIQAAIDVFPGSRVEVQGHTDAFGADDANMALSLRRAQAVQAYLLANTQLRGVTVEATGYGETAPLANNETAEGRLRNRRIDLLIEPNLDALIAEISGN